MNTTPICSAPRCGRPSPHGYLCPDCRRTLVNDLEALPSILDDLETTVCRQDRFGDSSRRPGDERPLPFRVFALEARRDVCATVVQWGFHVWARTGRLAPPRFWFKPEKVAGWLTTAISDVDSDPLAGTLADEIGWARVLGQRATDRPAELKYGGPCDECGSDLYAHADAPEVECRACNAAYRLETRRTWLLQQAEAHLLTATEMSRALPGLLPKDKRGEQPPLTAAMIRSWAHRGRIMQHPPHPRKPNDPLYRVGDVRQLTIELHTNRQLAG